MASVDELKARVEEHTQAILEAVRDFVIGHDAETVKVAAPDPAEPVAAAEEPAQEPTAASTVNVGQQDFAPPVPAGAEEPTTAADPTGGSSEPSEAGPTVSDSTTEAPDTSGL